jgi:hypothetical protein
MAQGQKQRGESGGRHRGLEQGGGSPLNTPLEDGELRGVDADGQPNQGTHGGPVHRKGLDKDKPTQR